MNNILKYILPGKAKYFFLAFLALAVLFTAQTFNVGQNSKVPVAEASAAADMYIKIGDIKGESTDRSHKEWIEVLSYNWALARDVNFGGSGRDVRVHNSEFTLSKYIDKASPLLMEALTSGEVVPRVQFEVRNPGEQEPYIVITMKDVIVTSFNDGGSSGQAPTEQLSLNYEEIKFEYKDKKGGKVEATWKVEEGES